MNYFYNVVVPDDERSRVESLEPFDEFEEWHLKCAHYVLVTAFRGSCLELLPSLWPRLSGADSCGPNSSSFRSTDIDCGTFLCVNKHFSHLSDPDNTQPLIPCNGDEVGGLFSSDGTGANNIEPSQSRIFPDMDPQLSLSVATSFRNGSYWKAAELTCISSLADTDTGCQRFGHTINRLLVNGRHTVAAVGGFGVAPSGRHHRLSHITSWNLSPMSAETYTVDNDRLLSRMCHATVTLPDVAPPGNPTCGNSSLVVIGGRHSRTSPVREQVVLVNFCRDTSSSNSVACRPVACSGDMPDPCWRHTVVATHINGLLFMLLSCSKTPLTSRALFCSISQVWLCKVRLLSAETS